MSRLFVDKISIGNGSLIDPAIKFTEDTDTGIYRIDANKIGITTNGNRVGEIGNGYGGFTGNVIQVVTNNSLGYLNTSLTTFVEFTSLNTIIIPKYNNSKILVTFTTTIYNGGGQGSECACYYGIRKNSLGINTDIFIQFHPIDQRSYYQPGQVVYPATIQFLDTISSLNEIIYKPIIRRDSGFSSVAFGYATNLSRHNLSLMEIQQ